MSIKIKNGSIISIEVYEDVGDGDFFHYSGETEGVVTEIYDYNNNKLKKSDTLKEIKLVANFEGEFLEVDEGYYKIVKI